MLVLLLLPGMFEEAVADLMTAFADEHEAVIEVGAAAVVAVMVML